MGHLEGLAIWITNQGTRKNLAIVVYGLWETYCSVKKVSYLKGSSTNKKNTIHIKHIEMLYIKKRDNKKKHLETQLRLSQGAI